MLDSVMRAFQNTPSRLKVAKLFLKNGFKVTEKGIFADNVEISPTKVARAVGVDRKVVDMCIQVILSDSELYNIFSHLNCVADISDVAKYTRTQKKHGVMIIRAHSSEIGIAAFVTKLLADEQILIRYMLCKDPEISVDSVMIIVTETPIPGRIVDAILSNEKIISVTLS